MKPTDRLLLADVRDRHIVHHGDDKSGYDWNNRTGRDVTTGVRRLELAQLVSRVGNPTAWQWRPTRAGHAELQQGAGS